MSIKSIADYTKDRLSRAFQYFPLGWLGKAKVEKSPQSETVFKEKLKQVISLQGHHVRFLPYADRYTEETDEIRKAYPVMLRDPYIKQALYTKVFGVASLDLQMHSASKSSRDKEIAEFAKHCIQKCRGGSRRAIMSIAIPGAIFGYSVTEINLRKPTSRGQFGQKITIESLKSKDVNKVQLEGDEFGNISGVRDKITNQFYHASNFLIYSHMPLFETPTGISDFRAAYRAYWLADTAWQLRAIGLERYGLPVIKGTYRTDAEQFALEQSLPNLRSQGWITVPEGALVEAMDIAARGTTDFESAIRDLREEMVLAIAGAILQMLTTTGTAEMRGSADVQKGTFELLQWYLAQEAADVLNDQLFPQLIDLNYRGADYPTCTFGGVNDGAMKDSITVDQFFLQSNLPLSKEEMYEKYGRQQPLSEDDAVTSPQAQQPQMPFGGGGGFGGGQFAEDGIDPQATVADQAKQIMGIQQVYAAGKIPRSAAIANAQLIKPDLAPDAAAALFPLRQAMPDGSAKFDESFAEKWITIGGKSGDDGKKKNGGKRVIIDDATGEIKGGAVPKAWQGKKVGEKSTYAKTAAKPAKKPSKPAAKPAPTPEAPVTDTDRDHVLKSLEGSPVHDIADLRKKLAKQLPGAKFDKAILDLADNRKIQVSQDSDPNRWTAEQRKQFVVEGDKVYTNVMRMAETPDTVTAPAVAFDDEIDSVVVPPPASQSIYWPDIRQEHSWDCGPAEIVAAGRFCGIAMTPVDYVARECGSHETQDTSPGKLVRVLKAYGIECQPKSNLGISGLVNHVQAGRPVVVHVTNWDGEDHYIAIIGVDGPHLEYHDPDGGYGRISQADFAKHWDGVDRFGVRYPRWGVAIIGRRGDGPDHAQQFDDDPKDSIIANAPHQDTDNAIRLSQASQQNGVEVVAKITEDAVTRLARLANPLQSASLFTMEERQALSDALASTLATADLLGRSRTHIRAEQVRRKAGGYKFSEPTSFQRFDDDPAPEAARVSALPPSRALEYFASLVPTITVSPSYPTDIATKAFTLAGVTETNILQRIKDVIQGRLEGGRAFRSAPNEIRQVLDEAGVSVRNPQYSEMVFRTNMIQSYNRGSMDSMRDPDVAEIFPAWQYHGIRDGRQRLQHQAHFGRYFTNDVDFEMVRDHFYDGEFSGHNCRCTISPVSKYEWKRLQERGEKLSELGSYPMPLS